MIKIEKVVLPNGEQLNTVIRGTRNPLNSWSRSDSGYVGLDLPYKYKIGNNDLDLMKRLVLGGTEHRKFMRMITVYADITAPLYWWKEFDTYKVGTVANSCSTMHKIHDKEFTLDDFSHEHLKTLKSKRLHDDTITNFDYLDPLKMTITALNVARKMYLETKDKEYWYAMIQSLPTNYNQKRTVMLNYEVLLNVYFQRKNHKLDEWKDMCELIETLPLMKEFIEVINNESTN